MKFKLCSKENYIITTEQEQQKINLIFSNNDVWINFREYMKLLKYTHIPLDLSPDLIKQKKDLITNYNSDDSLDFYTNYTGLYIVVCFYENINKPLYKFNFNLISKYFLPKIKKYIKYNKKRVNKMNNIIIDNLSDTSYC
jgi:hypothetical protein